MNKELLISILDDCIKMKEEAASMYSFFFDDADFLCGIKEGQPKSEISRIFKALKEDTERHIEIFKETKNRIKTVVIDAGRRKT